MRNLSLSDRPRLTLVAGALMASALVGSSVSQADTCRPWHSEVSAQFHNSHHDQDGNLIYAEAYGAGYASYIGAITVIGLNHVAPPVNGTVVVDGTGIMTGTNGDQIFLSFDGTVLDLATGQGTGTYVVTGGRGRFEGARGRAPFTSSFLAPNGFTTVADGILCY